MFTEQIRAIQKLLTEPDWNEREDVKEKCMKLGDEVGLQWWEILSWIQTGRCPRMEILDMAEDLEELRKASRSV